MCAPRTLTLVGLATAVEASPQTWARALLAPALVSHWEWGPVESEQCGKGQGRLVGTPQTWEKEDSSDRASTGQFQT